MLYSLSEAIDVPTIVMVSITGKNGIIHGRRMQLKPGVLYETDDKVMADSLDAYTEKKQYSVALEDRLKAYGAKYVVDTCRVCGGRKKFIIYHPVEVEYENA